MGLSLGLLFLLHSVLPVGPSGWHWAHLFAAELFYLPILASAAWFGRGGLLLTLFAASLLSGFHDLVAWQGFGMLQQAHGAQVLGLWVAGGVAWGFFEQKRRSILETQRAHAETLRVMALSLEMREPYTEGHSERVQAYTHLLAKALGIRDPSVLETYATGAFLHDIGKIGIPDSILLKEGQLSGGEWEVMRTHSILGAKLVGSISFLTGAKELVQAHHERYDGKGYPNGLSGEDIPLGARLFAVSDTFDALTTSRPYHQPESFEAAVRVISGEGGKQFDPLVVHAFLSVPFEVWAVTATELGVTLHRDG